MTAWDDGKPAQWITETEPEFDANERESWHELWVYEKSLCPHCGNLRAVCSDPGGEDGRGFYPQRTICYASRAQTAAQRAFAARHDKAAEPSKVTGWLTPSDGWTVWASTEDLTPDDDFDGAL